MVQEAKPRLGREAWIEAALAAIDREGVRAVRVEALARELGVTKGSFYWHFADRRALLDAVLEHWEHVATNSVIDRVEDEGGDAAERLARLARICFRSSQVERIEAGVRAWGASDERVRAVLERTDRRRIDYVTALLTEAGLPRATARRRSRIMYLVMIGDFTFRSHGGSGTSPALQQEMLSLLLQSDGSG